jgi:hypothetical protein
MTSATDAENLDPRFEIILDYSWRSHLGDESRQSRAQAAAEYQAGQEALAFAKMLDAFEAAATPIAAECKRNVASFQPSRRFQNNHYDGGIDTTHITEVIATCAGAVPLSLIIKAARDILVKWLAKRPTGIKIKLGDGRAIEVPTVADLDAVLMRLDQSEFAKPAPKPAARKVAGKAKKAPANAAGAKAGRKRTAATP